MMILIMLSSLILQHVEDVLRNRLLKFTSEKKINQRNKKDEEENFQIKCGFLFLFFLFFIWKVIIFFSMSVIQV